ncbi:phage tail protein [Halomonas daqingensis]|uniref:Phage tail protein n=1 Tax=Billgrantia desiderata TaxID=52021 RepID=A0ABS9B5F2_9GAMM|nr:phage tail assembly chaperone [Halomonas desiderata]MCE8042434.1 phage tail protein [Halomonas desiderata]MCE8047009.1 phage tail protein [Halomonas desiderata]
MARRKSTTTIDPRAALLAPLAGFRHRAMPVGDTGAQVIVREPGADDWLTWQQHLQAAAGEDVTEENAEEVAERVTASKDHTPEAALLVRVLLDPDTHDRIFSDDDVPEVNRLWGPVYGRYLNAAFELAGLNTATPVEDAAKN